MLQQRSDVLDIYGPHVVSVAIMLAKSWCCCHPVIHTVAEVTAANVQPFLTAGN